MLVKHIPISSVIVKREERQRKEIKTEDLEDSFRRIGQLHPIIVNTVDGVTTLVAGERRLTAATKLGWENIYASEKNSLTEQEQKIIELEENLKRVDLSWQDRCLAVYDLHQQYSAAHDKWTLSATADRIGLSVQTVSESVTTVEAMRDGNTKIAEAPTRGAALNIIRRDNNRIIAATLAELTEVDVDQLGDQAEKAPLQMIPASASILNEDFHKWAGTYDGPKFNFIHCDFPYGVNIDKSDQANKSETAEAYEDSRETFHRCIATLASCQNQLISKNATIMFWFDMAYYIETLELLREHLDFNIYPIPLIWFKSDNAGIVSDAKRRARHVYEACFYGHRGDNVVAKVVSDCYAAPTQRVEHMSTKPEPMLRHFMEAFVDKNTRMLDPTCGSGSSLRAAESLEASYVLGLELNKTFAEHAQSNLQIFRNKRLASMQAK